MKVAKFLVNIRATRWKSSRKKEKAQFWIKLQREPNLKRIMWIFNIFTIYFVGKFEKRRKRKRERKKEFPSNVIKMLQYKMRCKKSLNLSMQTYVPKAADRKNHSKYADLCVLDLIGLIKCFSWKFLLFPINYALIQLLCHLKNAVSIIRCAIHTYMNDFGQFWCFLWHRIYYWFEKQWWGTFFYQFLLHFQMHD